MSIGTFFARALSFVVAAGVLAATAPACSQGEGEGRITGTLTVPECWNGDFDLAPDFFSAVPYREGLQLRIQNGSDFENFADGVSILLYDIGKVRPNPDKNYAGRYGEALKVSLPPEVTPPGQPIKPTSDPPIVSLTLSLQKSCRTANVTLHAVEQVDLPTDGSCDAKPLLGADPTTGCDAQSASPGGFGTGRSLMAFTHVFDGKLDEADAAERLTAGCFDVYLADPREQAPGGDGPPPKCRGHLRGSFSFFFERGRPSQPFP